MSWCAGRHAVVTGGGSGIGAAIASMLAGEGARLTIIGRNAEQLTASAEKIGATARPADVTIREDIRNAFADAAHEHGPIELLVNNAGAATSVPFAKMDDEHWDSTMAVNLGGVYNCTRAVVAGMLEQGCGRIINIASTAALSGYAYVSAYCAAKHGVIGLTRSLALEYATKGITVNAVCPGYTDTAIVQSAVENIAQKTGRSIEDALADLVRSNPQGRLVQPQEVAETVLWLCEQKSMTGQAIAVAGGEVM